MVVFIIVVVVVVNSYVLIFDSFCWYVGHSWWMVVPFPSVMVISGEQSHKSHVKSKSGKKSWTSQVTNKQ